MMMVCILTIRHFRTIPHSTHLSLLPHFFNRGVLTRPELAMCLAAEVVYELDEEVRGHCAALAHAALLGTASAEPLVARHALQLLIHLLHSLSARHCYLHRISGELRACLCRTPGVECSVCIPWP